MRDAWGGAQSKLVRLFLKIDTTAMILLNAMSYICYISKWEEGHKYIWNRTKKPDQGLSIFDLFDFHFLFSPVDFLKLVDFASADQDPRGR